MRTLKEIEQYVEDLKETITNDLYDQGYVVGQIEAYGEMLEIIKQLKCADCVELINQ